MKNDPNIGEGCKIKQTPQGVYVDGVYLLNSSEEDF